MKSTENLSSQLEITGKVPIQILKVARIFAGGGFESYLVGGAVRDMLLGKKCNDYDIATNAIPEDTIRLFKHFAKVIPTGIAHGTVTVCIFGFQIEVTTFRTEGIYTDARHPDKIEYTPSIEEDLSRRDFTMNAIALNILSGELVDPFGGRSDINKKIIRAVGSPHERFCEDGLRPIRAIRFASQLRFEIESGTLSAMSQSDVLMAVARISKERFRDEWCKILTTEKPSIGLKLLDGSGILELFIPEFEECKGCAQSDVRGYHDFDVADHIMYACDGDKSGKLIIRLALFFHDIGKPDVKEIEIKDGRPLIHFHSHEIVSEKKAQNIMKRLKFSNEEIHKVCNLVRNHTFNYESAWSDSAVRRLLIRVGKENFEDLLLVRYGDIYGKHCTPLKEGSPTWKNLSELKRRVYEISEREDALSIKDLKVNGNDLISIGIPHGKMIGQILKELFECVTDNPSINEKESLIALAKNIYNKKTSLIGTENMPDDSSIH